MKPKRFVIRKTVEGIMLLAAVVLYYVFEVFLEAKLKRFSITTFRYDILLWIRFFYGMLGAIVIRLMHFLIIERGSTKIVINIPAIVMCVGLILFAILAWNINSLRIVILKQTFIILLFTTLFFTLYRTTK